MNMPTHVRLPMHTNQIVAFCRKWGIREFALFGSVLRGDFRPDSDLDVLVTFAPERKPGWLDRIQMIQELQELCGRRVDLVERRAVADSPNYIRRQQILKSAEVIYAA